MSKIIHFFHWPGSRSYQQYYLRFLALPVGAKACLDYNEKYLGESFDIKKIKSYIGCKCIFWVSSCKMVHGKPDYDFAYPLRFLKVTDIVQRSSSNMINFEFIVLDYLDVNEPISSIEVLENYVIKFDSVNKAPHKGEEPHLVFVGLENDNINNLKKGDLKLEKIYNLLKNSECINLTEIKIGQYPFIKIVDLGSYKLNIKTGLAKPSLIKHLYKFYKEKSDSIYLEFYQGDVNRNNRYKINDVLFMGKEEGSNKPLPISNFADGSLKIEVQGIDNTISYDIPIITNSVSLSDKLLFTLCVLLFWFSPLILLLFLKEPLKIDEAIFFNSQLTLFCTFVIASLISLNQVWKITKYINVFR